MNDDNFAFRIIDCAELVLASKGEDEKKLAMLIELERMVDYARPTVADGISEEQARAYRSRELAMRKQITDWAHTLTLEAQAAAKEQVLTRGPAYYTTAVLLSIAGGPVPGANPQVHGPSNGTAKGILNRFFK